jgi:aryl-alcohol dehydrogenase-like predicted oxidoreductase
VNHAAAAPDVPLRPLGASGISVPALGVGTNGWTTKDPVRSRLRETWAAALDAGTGFFDSAEVYNFGLSEIAIGRASRGDGRPVVVASKFLPLPPRVSAAQFDTALDRTLARLGRDSLDLYYLHFPYSLRRVDHWMEPMARAVEDGRIGAVGISNCDPEQMRRAADVLAQRGIALAANQVHYSLLHRRPERNGVLEACRRMGVALVAYQPIEAGIIAGDAADDPSLSDLRAVLQSVATVHGATPAQVALAWLLQRDEHVIAIPGATRPEHVRENAGALALRLVEDEFDAVDCASASAERAGLGTRVLRWRSRYSPEDGQGSSRRPRRGGHGS